MIIFAVAFAVPFGTAATLVAADIAIKNGMPVRGDPPAPRGYYKETVWTGHSFETRRIPMY